MALNFLFDLILLNLNSHTWLEATVLGGVGLDREFHGCRKKKILHKKFKSLLSQSSGIIIINYNNRNS